jgi:hypothetical protein
LTLMVAAKLALPTNALSKPTTRAQTRTRCLLLIIAGSLPERQQ